MNDPLEAKKRRAFEDFYNGGEPRSLSELANHYNRLQAEGFDVPTTSLSLLTVWSRENSPSNPDWQAQLNERRSSQQEKLEALLTTEQADLARQRFSVARSALDLAQYILNLINERFKAGDLTELKISQLASFIPNAIKLAEFGSRESRLEENANQEQILSEAIEKVLAAFPPQIQERLRAELQKANGTGF